MLAEKIKSIANVEIEYYKQSNKSAMTTTFKDLKIMKNIDKSSCLDFLSFVIWPLVVVILHSVCLKLAWELRIKSSNHQYMFKI